MDTVHVPPRPLPPTHTHGSPQIIFGIMPFWGKFRNWHVYKRALPGFNAAGVGLIIASVFSLTLGAMQVGGLVIRGLGALGALGAGGGSPQPLKFTCLHLRALALCTHTAPKPQAPFTHRTAPPPPPPPPPTHRRAPSPWRPSAWA